MNNNLTFYNPSVTASRATSLYTREAYHRPTVHLKGVTHYTLQGKVCENEYEQIVRTHFSASAGKPALWKSPLMAYFFIGPSCGTRPSADGALVGSDSPLDCHSLPIRLRLPEKYCGALLYPCIFRPLPSAYCSLHLPLAAFTNAHPSIPLIV